MRNIQTAERATPRPKPSFCRQSQRAPRDDAKLAVSKILQNATESGKIRQKLVCAHVREIPQPPTSFPRRRESLSCNHPRHSREGGNPFLATTRVIPAKAGIPFLQPPTSFPRRRESPSCNHPRHSREGGNPLLSACLAPSPQRIGRIHWNCRPLAVMPTDRAKSLWRLLTPPRACVEVTSGRRPAVRNISYHGSAAS